MTKPTLPQAHPSDQLAGECALDHPCGGCGRLFTPRRIWQRHCSGPRRAAASRHGEADRLTERLERLRPTTRADRFGSPLPTVSASSVLNERATLSEASRPCIDVLLPGRPCLQPNGSCNLALAYVERDEIAQPEFQRRRHVKHIEGPAPELGGVGATDVGGTPQRGAPQDVDLRSSP